MLFFIDESGTDHGKSDYEVLAAIAVKEKDLWNLTQTILSLQDKHFGSHLSAYGVEMKGSTLLKPRSFKHAANGAVFGDVDARRAACISFLDKGRRNHEGEKVALRDFEFGAWGQSAIAFCHEVLDVVARFRCPVFASVVSLSAPKPTNIFLRKDYAYLFERFFYYLEDTSKEEMGLVVFDETEKENSRRLIKLLTGYFSNTTKGRFRSSRIVPEPFFVHSDITTAVQIVDVIAYCINFGLRMKKMTKKKREELVSYADKIFDLRFISKPRVVKSGDPATTQYGIVYIDDLRPKPKAGKS